MPLHSLRDVVDMHGYSKALTIAVHVILREVSTPTMPLHSLLWYVVDMHRYPEATSQDT